MTIYYIEANGTIMGEYAGETAADALDAYAQDAGYADYADVVAQCGDDATATEIDTDAIVAAVAALNMPVFQDAYGNGIAVVNGQSIATYDDLSKLANKRIWDFSA